MFLALHTLIGGLTHRPLAFKHLRFKGAVAGRVTGSLTIQGCRWSSRVDHSLNYSKALHDTIRKVVLLRPNKAHLSDPRKNFPPKSVSTHESTSPQSLPEGLVGLE